MSEAEITQDQWLKTLQEAERAGGIEEGLTAREIARVWDVNVATARQKLRTLHEQGNIRHAGYRRVRQIDGKMGNLPTYKLAKSPAAG